MMKRYSLGLVISLFVFALLVACHATSEPAVFDAENAYGYVASQVAIGARYTGSAGHQEMQELISNALEENNWNVEA